MTQSRGVGRGYRGTLAERFWENVEPEPMSGCLIWVGSRTKKGYGQIAVKRPNGYRMEKAHRVALELEGVEILPGRRALHRCDMRPCVNWVHLFQGTPADNSRDMVLKGRSMRGHRQPMSKLTEDQIVEIRRRATTGERHEVIAAAFGVVRQTIGDVVHRTWRHI